PCSGNIWGDCARSYIVENGFVSATPTNPELRRGVEAESYLHAEMRKFVNPDVSFHTLHEFANDLITSIGFVNLDFLGNVGHSIANTLDGRLFIEAGNHQKLASTRFFTFEPHIRHHNGKWGFKHEDIYYFDDSGGIVVL
ncbi:MAG: M24 family metallopeptidase, partial [Nitrospira sp.]|nr:M24 family metallopeptidase [Nitrospira sp.]